MLFNILTDVDNKNTYPSKVQELSDNKWNCINLGIYGGSLDMAYLIFNKIKDLDIDDIVIQYKIKSINHISLC